MKLVDTFAEIFAQLQELFGPNGQCKAYEYDELLALFTEQLERQAILAEKVGYESYEIDGAKFSVVALIDEIVLESNWEGLSQWRTNLLQKQHFSTVNGGVEFFERLEALNPFKPLERDIREVYYYCLTLGFKGQYYRTEDEGTLRSIVDKNFDVLTVDTGDRLFPAAYESVKTEAIIPSTPVNWKPVWMSFPVLAWCAFYFHYKADVVTQIQMLIAEL